MISHSEVAAARIVFVKVRGMLGKRYIPWLWTQGRHVRVRKRRRDAARGRRCVRRAEIGADL